MVEYYELRWQIEVFFKALKQNLKIKTFVGTSENALLIQIWTGLIALLLLRWLHCLCQKPRIEVGAGPSAEGLGVLSLGVVGHQIVGGQRDYLTVRLALIGDDALFPAEFKDPV